ncbi:PAS domain-containing protein [Halegenticoccus soli]|uniref:PAS domain-containing protein n=1 Tax=Halegenticoccus soli TaxID=1985678 RepID=UPI000C6EBB9D|nr:PAS domain-containing protein [Halegenticoccus soli]
MGSGGSAQDTRTETLAVFTRAESPYAPLTTSEVADSLGCGRRAAYDRLAELVEQGDIRTKKVGARGRVWWRVPADRAAKADPEAATEKLQRERTLTARILDAVPVRVSVITPDGEIDRSNRLFDEYLAESARGDEYEVGLWDLYDETGRYVPPEDRPYMRIFATGEPVHGWRGQIELPTGERRWFSVSAIPMKRDGNDVHRVVVSVDDITEFKNQSRRLERQRDDLKRELDEVFERIDDAFFALDEQWRFTYVNDRAEQFLEKTEAELLGNSVWEEFSEAVGSTFQERYEQALITQQSVSFEAYYPPLDAWFEVRAYPSETGLSVYFRDVTERKERERALERSEQRYRTLAEHFPNGAVALFDEELRYTLLEGAIFDDYEVPTRELVGRRIGTLAPDPETRELVERCYAAALDGETNSYEFEWNDREFQAWTLPVTDENGEVFAGMVMTQDVTDRKRRERELEQYERIVETIWDGVYAVDEDDRFALVNDAYASMLGYDPEELLGEHASRVHSETTNEELGRLNEEMVAGEREQASVELDLRTADGETVPTETKFGPYRVDGERYGRVGVTRDVTDRKRRERQLDRQRERLAALNNLNGVVRDINEALVRQSTRGEIERTVCERLAASDSYRFAWIAEVDPKERSIRPRVEAGVDGYLDEIPLSVESDEPTGRGPVGRTVRTRKTQVSQDVFADPDFEPWREYAEKYGYRSVAVVPIVHEDALYGILGVYARRTDAFTGEEREVIDQLGEIVGHTIAAVERKRALMSDDVVEVEFRLRDVFDAIDVRATADGTITLDRTVPVGGGTYLEYGTATEDAVDALETLVERLPHWEDVTILSRRFGDTTFELRLSKPPVVSAVASHGGYVKEATIEDGDYHMTIHLPPSVDVRDVTRTVQSAYPEIEMVTRRQIARTDEAPKRIERTFTEDLTDHQRTALEVAFHSGFFEWPRDSSGEEVAASLGVSPSTFHQHVRLAEKKLFGALFTEPRPLRE